MNFRVISTFLFFVTLPTGNVPAGDLNVQLSNAWIREAPPATMVQAGYFTACNASDSPVMLLEFSSERFGRIEMHETVEADGKTRMRKLDTVKIEAGDCIDFAPGGRHLMLFDATTPARDGDVVTLVLELDAGTLAHDFPVRRGNGESTSHGHHHE